MTQAQDTALVLGMGRSGRAAAALLLREGVAVHAYDRDPAHLEGLDPAITTVHGPTPPAFHAFDRVVASPGIAIDAHPKLVPEVDLAAQHLQAPLIGVTGTNGKSTTVVLVGEMLRESGLRATVGGNLGTALCELVDAPADWVVAELSSFQLEHARALHARIAVLLNLSPDHLDRHDTLASYGAAKARLAELQDPEDTLVANHDDPWARAVAERVPQTPTWFSTQTNLTAGACVEDDSLVLRSEQGTTLRLAVEDVSPACRQQLGNALAALATASRAGASGDAITRVLREFKGLPHRAELVCTRRGVRYVNDSKATNPAAAAASVDAQSESTWWLAGGQNKGLDYAPLERVATRVRMVIVFGAAAPALEAALTAAKAEVLRVDTLDRALEAAAERAESGDVVLLAPACASFDAFPSFEARGDHFAELARALPC